MFKYYFKTAWRNLMKNKMFSFINIAGLAIGMAACLLILEYVHFELSYDQFNKNADDIYRVVNDRYQNGKQVKHTTMTYSAISKAMAHDYPELINFTPMQRGGQRIISYNTKRIGGQNLLWVENSFLAMFSYPLLAGNAATALIEPGTTVISETLAKKIFGANNHLESLIGKVISDEGRRPIKITGIFRDVPENSHLQFDMLLSYSSLDWITAENELTYPGMYHYIQLKPGTNYKVFETKLSAFSQKYFQGNKISGSVEKFYLQPLSKAHLYSDFEDEIGKTGSAVAVWGLLIIAVLIIVIAWINYINLATAKALERAKEVGIRKVTGATRQQLIGQFLTESFIINIVALLIALLLVNLAQDGFNRLVQHQLSLFYLFEKGLNGYSSIFTLIAFIVVGIFVSGFYPSVVLSSFKPIMVLKGKFTRSNRGILLRKVLVIGQFAVTIALIIGSFVVFRQIKFINEQNLGMNISQMLIVKGPALTQWDTTFLRKENSFTNELMQIPGVLGASYSQSLPGEELWTDSDVKRTDDPAEPHFTVHHNGVGPGFVDLYQMRLVAGREFIATDYGDKPHNIIINNAALKLFGFKSANDAMGKQINDEGNKYDVIGVVANFHQRSLHYPIEPTMFKPTYSMFHRFSVKVDPRDLSSKITAIKKKYDSFFPGNLFDYYFLDEKFNEQYGNDRLFGIVFSIFSGFAIFIACLGLFGLSLLTILQRTKEIGIRKVLGASVSTIVMLISKDFIKLVIIAFAIAWPVAWFVMNKWLQNFAFRIQISWWIFFAAGSLAVIIALATISFQSITAAVANPVKSLQTE
ncbi:ABC transporter permease [Flavihumibacter profundi]|uniref:ABC transporter permease n=1 Tax=Flavihumibacter profundi TaxID=2716883 RepID=UPI001CC6436E|nr:ABC transporter permease [Flavihumibacter profundi]MBZ5859096.1 ABC transporter permease [Flavihumibacter profundi]